VQEESCAGQRVHMPCKMLGPNQIIAGMKAKLLPNGNSPSHPFTNWTLYTLIPFLRAPTSLRRQGGRLGA